MCWSGRIILLQLVFIVNNLFRVVETHYLLQNNDCYNSRPCCVRSSRGWTSLFYNSINIEVNTSLMCALVFLWLELVPGSLRRLPHTQHGQAVYRFISMIPLSRTLTRTNEPPSWRYRVQWERLQSRRSCSRPWRGTLRTCRATRRVGFLEVEPE